MTKRSTIRSTMKNLNNSSVVVQDSPVSSMKQKGNLTGNARLMRDHVIEMSYLIQTWNEQLIEGMNLVTEIKNIVQKKITDKRTEITSHISILQKSCLALHKISTNMQSIVENMSELSTRVSAVGQLEQRHGNLRIMFLTWPTSKFIEISQLICDAHRRELAMKISVEEQLCFCTDADTLVLLESAWLQEPYIDRHVSMQYQAMLAEVGYSQFRRK